MRVYVYTCMSTCTATYVYEIVYVHVYEYPNLFTAPGHLNPAHCILVHGFPVS